MQLDGGDEEIGCWDIDVCSTENEYVKSEGTPRSVCLSGRAAHDACFMMIGKFPFEVIVGGTSLNGVVLG